MPDDRPQSLAGTYIITAIDKVRGTSAVAAGLTFPKAVALKAALVKHWPDVTFIVEPEPDPSRFNYHRPVYQIIGVNQDCSRTLLMYGMTLDEAESARDALVKGSEYLWVWIEREPG